MITEQMLEVIKAVSDQNEVNECNIKQFETDMYSYGLGRMVEDFRDDGTLLERATEWVDSEWLKLYVETAYNNGMCEGFITSCEG